MKIKGNNSLRKKNIRLIGVPEGAERDRGPEYVFKQIIAENIPNLGRETGISDPLYFLHLNACFPSQIRNVFSYYLFKYLFWPSVHFGALGNPNYT